MVTKHVYYVVSNFRRRGEGIWRTTEVFQDEPITTWEQVEALADWLAYRSPDRPQPETEHTVVSFQLLRVQELAEAPPGS